jgi:hypothetical protein
MPQSPLWRLLHGLRTVWHRHTSPKKFHDIASTDHSKVVVAFIGGGALLLPAYAADGNLDATFGNGGIVTVPSFPAYTFG